ncbi:MAG: VWA domain-containing protein [Bacteroidia bacterium]|nr:VWA domain-containing protein [Bacteroidia bacterium]
MENPFKQANVHLPVRNAEQKCLCVLCLDVSGSMDGEPIQELNKGVEEFFRAVKEDPVARKRLEVCIITFNNKIVCVQEPDLVDYMPTPVLEAGGSTRLVDGVRAAIRKVDERKNYDQTHGINYYRPFIILMTDGEPDDDQDVKGLATEIRQGAEAKQYTFWAIGSEGYNHSILASICHPYPPKPLNGLNYVEFFKWLSATLTVVSKSSISQAITPPPTSSWELSDLSTNPTQRTI